MSFQPKPVVRHPNLVVNAIGLTERDYEGAISTLCAGCGHDSISSAIMQACHQLDLPPHRVAKISGIGCSSKTPTYFLGKAHGFNSVHGRMPSIATGANLANRDLVYMGVSGDGDTASIGLGQFMHVMRRQLNMLYLVENNGVYGLTKGQFSATSDPDSKSKTGQINEMPGIDLVALAIQNGASFVARSFSGDKEQLVPLIKLGLKHKGFAFIDCISPCVTFNNHPGSTRSYEYFREHELALINADYIPLREEITTAYEPGNTQSVTLHDGSTMVLKKLADDYDPQNRMEAMNTIQEHAQKGEIATGLLYYEQNPKELHEHLNTSRQPLNELPMAKLTPGNDQLQAINASLR